MGRRTDTKRASMMSDLERYCSMGSLRFTNTPPPSRLDRTTHSPVSLSSHAHDQTNGVKGAKKGEGRRRGGVTHLRRVLLQLTCTRADSREWKKRRSKRQNSSCKSTQSPSSSSGTSCTLPPAPCCILRWPAPKMLRANSTGLVFPGKTNSEIVNNSFSF